MHRSARGVDVPGADTYPLQLQLLLSCAFFILAHFQGERNGEKDGDDEGQDRSGPADGLRHLFPIPRICRPQPCGSFEQFASDGLSTWWLHP